MSGVILGVGYEGSCDILFQRETNAIVLPGTLQWKNYSFLLCVVNAPENMILGGGILKHSKIVSSNIPCCPGMHGKAWWGGLNP